MTRSNKAIAFIFAFLPIVLLITYIIMIFAMIPQFIDMGNDPTLEHGKDREILSQVFSTFAPLMGIILGLIIARLAGMIYFLVHAINNKTISSTERIIWVIVFILAGTIGFPVYWFIRINNSGPVPEAAV